MNIEAIQTEFRNKVCSEISIASEGTNRFRVFTPFHFDDGDCLGIVLKQEEGRWHFSDEGHTLMHLTYGIEEKDLQRGNRQKIIGNAIENFRLKDQSGELTMDIPEERFGDGLFDFAQALLKISDVTYLTRERVKSTFIEDFRELVSSTVPEERRQFNWFDKKRDPKSNYPVDCRINGMQQPLFIFALGNDDRVQVATICAHQFENWKVPFRAIGIFENQEEINRKVLARFSDVCDKQFSSLTGNSTRISQYIKEQLK
jgi:hypothetical protein